MPSSVLNNTHPPQPPGRSNSTLKSILSEARAGAATPNSATPYSTRCPAPPSAVQPTRTTGLQTVIVPTSPSTSPPLPASHCTARYTDISLCDANHMRLRLEWHPSDPVNNRGTWRLLRRDYRERTNDGHAAHAACVEYAVENRLAGLAARVVQDLAWDGEGRGPGEGRVRRELRVLAGMQMGSFGDKGEKKGGAVAVAVAVGGEEARIAGEERRSAVREWERERWARGQEIKRVRAEFLRRAKREEEVEEVGLSSGMKRPADPEGDGEAAVKRRRMLLGDDPVRGSELTNRKHGADVIPRSSSPHRDADGESVKAREKRVPLSEEADTAPGSISPSNLEKRSAPIAADCSPPRLKRKKLTSEPQTCVGCLDEVEAESTISSPVFSPSTPPSPTRRISLATPPTSPSSPSVSVDRAKRRFRKVQFSAEVEVREYEVVSPVVSPNQSEGESDDDSDDGLAALMEAELVALEGGDEQDEEEGEGKGDSGAELEMETDGAEDDGLDYLFEDEDDGLDPRLGIEA